MSGLGVYITKFVTVHDRFSQTFEFRVGENLSMTEVMGTFANEKENLNFELDDRDVRTLVADLFGEVKTFYPRRDGKRVAVFLNISKKRPDETTKDTWKSMEISCVMNGWVLREKNVNPPSLSFSRLAGVYIDGNEVVIQLKINPLTTEFSLKSFLGNTLTHDTFGFKANETKNLHFILEYLARFSVCCGLPANDHNDSVVRKDSDEMCTQVKIGTRTAYLSRKCHQVVPSLGETCVECGYLKRLLSKRKETYSNIMKTKNSLLGDEEKLAKVNFILKEKRNAQRREKYWRTKFESECLCATDEDHLDFKSILSSVDTSKIKGDMALLLEQQQMALTRKSSTGYRWHPK